MKDISVKKKFQVLCEIVRAQHFAWYEAVSEMCPDVDPAEVAARMWEVTGKETARAYLKRIDPSLPLAAQVAGHVVSSSRCMGEDAVLTVSPDKDEAFVRHVACPWLRWHQALDSVDQDLMGCECWFRETVSEINQALGTDLCVETLEAMPNGDDSCLRRFWVGRND